MSKKIKNGYFDNVNPSHLISARDFSKITKVPVSTLKYYDEIGLLKPLKRKESKYRYYAPQQVITMNFIRVLSQCGVPVKTISEMEKNRKPKDHWAATTATRTTNVNNNTYQLEKKNSQNSNINNKCE
jgi:DNA-binding transcriptional MerR regulator